MALNMQLKERSYYGGFGSAFRLREAQKLGTLETRSRARIFIKKHVMYNRVMWICPDL